jgi:hypothetical protein
LLSSSFAFVLPTSSRRRPASSSSGWGKMTGPPRPPPAMSFPSGNVVVMPFVGADNENNSTVAPPQGSYFFKDVDGDYYNGLQNEDGEDPIAPGSAVLGDQRRRIRRIWRGGTNGLIVNRLALRNWRTPRGGSLTSTPSELGGEEIEAAGGGGWRRQRRRRGDGGDGNDLPRRTTKQLAWRERSTQQPTKAMEMTKALTTRTANARVKARSGVCECVDCCCCCFCSSWDRWTRCFEWPLSPLHRHCRAAVEDKSSPDQSTGLCHQQAVILH